MLSELLKKFVTILFKVSIGAIFYGLLGIFFSIPIGPNTVIMPSIIFLTIFSVYFGPLIGFCSGFLGHFFVDLYAGWGLWWNWELSSGFFGLAAGLISLFSNFNIRKGHFKTIHIILYCTFTLYAFLASSFFASAVDILVLEQSIRKVMIQVAFIILTDSLLFFIFSVPILILILKLNQKKNILKNTDNISVK